MLTELVKTSYSKKDVIILLQNLEGKVPILDTKEREELNQKGTHYSEMLPLEYVPTEKYMELYNESLKELSIDTANAVAILSEKIMKRKNFKPVIVSLARAGTPIGILVKRYIWKKYRIEVPHYSISIIRGKGIDVAAMKYILSKHSAEEIVFLDGWVGKGAINNVLNEAVKDLKERKISNDIAKLDSTLAVLSDPASVTDLYGTRQDFLIPSACLNSTVSGLISRTVKLKNMTDNEFHGAVYYKENEDFDYSEQFIQKVEDEFDNVDLNHFNPFVEEKNEDFKGIDEVNEIASKFSINDINKIKPGVGETTRVLLRRLPDRILIKENANDKYVKHLLQLAKEKNIPVEIYPLKKYNVCGIIKDIADL